MPKMPVLIAGKWIQDLETRFSFLLISTKKNDCSNPYDRAMCTFQSFTNDVASALRDDAGVNAGGIEDELLHKIYDDLPSFFDWDKFRDWVKDATLKHPHRRTPKQHQWLCIVDMQQRKSSNSMTALADMILQAADCPATWELSTYAIEDLLVDPDPRSFFRNNHAIKAAEEDEDDIGELCEICTNDFDTDLHSPQRTPCGHHQCRQCSQKSLKRVVATYTCAFCRACLVCGTNNCQHHIIPDHDEATPYSLIDFLMKGHYLCTHKTCMTTKPLCGLTPKRYWALREETRKDRSTLTNVLQLLQKNLTPEQRAYMDKEWLQLYELLKNRIELARLRQIDDEQTERHATLLKAIPWLGTPLSSPDGHHWASL